MADGGAEDMSDDPMDGIPLKNETRAEDSVYDDPSPDAAPLDNPPDELDERDD